jgi:heat shock protein HtpX
MTGLGGTLSRPVQHQGLAHALFGYARAVVLLGTLSALVVLIADWAGGPTAALWAVGITLALNLASFYFSDRMVLALHRARPITFEQAPRLYEIVGELARRSGIPEPPIYLVDDDAPNAFATGRNPRHAAVAVTAGALQRLDDDELAGVLAHELSHVKNRDTLISTIAATLAGAVVLVARLLSFQLLFGGSSDDRRRDGGGALGFLAILVAPLAATLVQLAVSRSREFAADASGARLLGTGEPLARALEDLEQASARVPMRTAQLETQHLYIVPPLRRGLANLFSTHPDTDERIRRLRAGRY